MAGVSEEPQNITCFNAAARTVLVKLHREFPRPVVLNSTALMAEIPAYCQGTWGPFHGDDNYVAATIRFLREEGYLRHVGTPDTKQTQFAGVVLTSRGFSVLQAPLDSLGLPAAEKTTVVGRLGENLSVSDVSLLMGLLLKLGLMLRL